MIFEVIIVSLIIGKLKGGELKNLENLYLRGWYLLVLSFSIEIISVFIVTRMYGSLSKLIEYNFFALHIFVYLLLLITLLINFREGGLKLTTLGTLLNFLSLVLNNGKMPVSIKALKNANLYNQLKLLSENRIMTHTLMTGATRLNVLGDIIPIPKPYPFPKIISIGDILISIGLFILIYSYMIKKEDNGKYI